MSVALLVKDPAAKLDYGFDWAAFLGAKTISSTSWNVPSDLINNGSTVNQANTVTTIILSGGTLGKQYVVTNQITMSDGTIDERSITILIQKK